MNPKLNRMRESNGGPIGAPNHAHDGAKPGLSEKTNAYRLRWPLVAALVPAYLGATVIPWLGYRAENPTACLAPECDLPAFEFESALFAISFALLFAVGLGLLLTRALSDRDSSHRVANPFVVAALSVVLLTRAIEATEPLSLARFPTQWWVAIVASSALLAGMSRGVPHAASRALVMAAVSGLAYAIPGLGAPIGALAVGVGSAWLFGQERDTAIVGGALSVFGWALFIGPDSGLAEIGLATGVSLLAASLAPAVVSAAASSGRSSSRRPLVATRPTTAPSTPETSPSSLVPGSATARSTVGRSSAPPIRPARDPSRSPLAP